MISLDERELQAGGSVRNARGSVYSAGRGPTADGRKCSGKDLEAADKDEGEFLMHREIDHNTFDNSLIDNQPESG
jgi:hypothetical protein